MDLLQMGAKLFGDAAGGGVDTDAVQSALAGLLGGEGGKLDLGGLVSGMQNGGLESLVQSWLGDGANAPLSSDQLAGLVDSEKMTEFASKLGMDAGSAQQALAQVLPNMIDKGSSGGSLLDSLGGAEGLMGMASKLFK